jgi:hypothetical protein
MDLAGLRATTRTLLDDATGPYLWPDEDIDRRLNNAVREACLRARLLRADAESDPKLCLLTVKPESGGRVPFDASILVIRTGSLSDGSHPLRMMSSDDMDRQEPGWDSGRQCTGRPCYIVVDLGQKILRLWPAPDTTVTLRLRAWRVPTENEWMSDGSDEPVIIIPDPEELCHWAAHECYLVKDAELFDADAAARHLGLFEQRFGTRPSLHEMARWADRPPRVRRAQMF